MHPRTIVLVGPMGSGKSTVGRALAHRLGLGHIDTDDMVTSAAGHSIADIFETAGEAGFRELEGQALRRALDGAINVVSTGGGIVVTDASRALLAESSALVVWLDASIETLVRRVGKGSGRPLLADTDVPSALAEKVDERSDAYAEVADLRVDTSELTHAACVDRVVAALESDVVA